MEARTVSTHWSCYTYCSDICSRYSRESHRVETTGSLIALPQVVYPASGDRSGPTSFPSLFLVKHVSCCATVHRLSERKDLSSNRTQHLLICAVCREACRIHEVQSCLSSLSMAVAFEARSRNSCWRRYGMSRPCHVRILEAASQEGWLKFVLHIGLRGLYFSLWS